MTALIEMLKNELANLVTLHADLMKDSVRPSSAAVISKEIRGNTYFWKSTKKNGRRTQTYLGNSTSDKLVKIAQSAYKRRLIDIVDYDIKIIKQTLAKIKSYETAAVFAGLSPALYNVQFDTEFSTVMKNLWDWAHAEYKRNTAPFGDTVIKAKDGRRVRSKSECIIYNALLDAGIPFRYDSVIPLKRRGKNGEIEIFYESPDFLIMLPDGSLIIIEHAGKLDSLQYAESLAKKLQLYQLNGYYLGYSLFVTSDEVLGGIDSEEIGRIIKIIKTHFPYM